MTFVANNLTPCTTWPAAGAAVVAWESVRGNVPGQLVRIAPDFSDEAPLQELVDLNAERAEEERQGLVRWLRPEFQKPAEKGKAQKQASTWALLRRRTATTTRPS